MPIHFLCGMREKIYLFPLLLHLKFFIPAKIIMWMTPHANICLVLKQMQLNTCNCFFWRHTSSKDICVFCLWLYKKEAHSLVYYQQMKFVIFNLWHWTYIRDVSLPEKSLSSDYTDLAGCQLSHIGKEKF